MRFQILPKDKNLFQRIEAAIGNAHSAAQVVQNLLGDYGALAERRAELKQLEHKGDMLTREIFDAAGRRTNARLRVELRTLAQAMDDVVDALYGTCNRLYLYDIPKPPPTMKPLADIVVLQTESLVKAITALGVPRAHTAALHHCAEVHRLENEADRLLNDAVARLFRGKDAVQIMKYTQIHEILEQATDCCDDVADAIHDVLRRGR